MSFALTVDAVRARTKDVTRRTGWHNLRRGDLVRAVEKGQGLKKGERVKPIAVIRIVDVRTERLDRMLTDDTYGVREVAREGLAPLAPRQFVAGFCASHRHDPVARRAGGVVTTGS
jgi:hypothetical protein